MGNPSLHTPWSPALLGGWPVGTFLGTPCMGMLDLRSMSMITSYLCFCLCWPAFVSTPLMVPPSLSASLCWDRHAACARLSSPSHSRADLANLSVSLAPPSLQARLLQGLIPGCPLFQVSPAQPLPPGAGCRVPLSGGLPPGRDRPALHGLHP